MKYAKAFYFLASVGLVLLAFLFGLRMLGAIMAAVTPVIDSIIRWMYDHAIVGGLFVGIAFLLWWFADVCDERDRKEKSK